MSRVLVVGDALLDRDVEGATTRLAPDAPVPVLDEADVRTRPGGAALAAVLAASFGDEVVLVSPIGDDGPGEELRSLLERRGVDVVRWSGGGATPEKIRFRSGGQALLRLDRSSRPAVVTPVPPEAVAAASEADVVLVADYGRGVTGQAELRRAIGSGRAPVVWDPHPRGASPVRAALLVTPNLAELPGDGGAEPAGDGGGGDLRARADRAERARSRWGAKGVAVTMGSAGAFHVDGAGPPLVVPARPLVGGDPCGAGDCFAAAAASVVGRGGLGSEAVVSAVAAATAFVANGGAAGWARFEPVDGVRRPEDAVELARQVQSRGGKVVATGGCFDILHAGHLASLRAMRQLGDCLVVCLNSDVSVRALKGADRPVVGQSDRAEALRALGCVDAVVLFDEPTPARLLEGLRPDIFAKGDDYGGRAIPEQAVLDRWGGQCVTVPYLAGYSTSRLVRGSVR
ncbi:MAG TPA: PfkB family carbohydrate kinase [Acidimicrobiales bacterium]|jgi:rfaE bifunctional protein nucleotidyltransferase chain/domain/rfaE bifunctional protein kinase chain/domain